MGSSAKRGQSREFLKSRFRSPDTIQLYHSTRAVLQYHPVKTDAHLYTVGHITRPATVSFEVNDNNVMTIGDGNLYRFESNL